MLIRYLTFLILQFPFFLLLRVPNILVNYYKNSLDGIDNRFQFRLNWRMFFVPLYGDTHWALRLAGILYRLSKGVFGVLLLLSYFIIYLVSALIILFIIPLSFFYSVNAFLILLGAYLILYIAHFLSSPFEVISYSKNYYNLFDVYKMSNFSGRNTLHKVLNREHLEKLFLELARFLEKDVQEILEYFPKKIDGKVLACSIISFGKIAGYRHVTSNLVLAGILSSSKEFIKFLELNNLPLHSLHSFLLITRNRSIHQAKMWEFDYESNYSFPYNISRLDRVSPTLDKYSLPFFTREKSLAISFINSFKKYKIDLIKTLNAGSKKVLIVGDVGTGKTSIVKDFYTSMQKGQVPEDLKFNRIVDVDLSNIVSLGQEGPETLSKVLDEFSKLKNTILFLDNLHILYSVIGTNYLDILLPYFENLDLRIISTSDHSHYISLVKSNPGIDALFRKIKIEELSGKELYDFLVIKNWDYHKKLTVPAINFLVESSTQILFEEHNPKKCINLIEQAQNVAPNKRFVEIADIASVIKKVTGVSLGNVSKSESQKLLGLEVQLKREVIGQDRAVAEVANSLIRSRGVQERTHKPIACFLFAGPTGVGKTELAKSLARNYFGGEREIVRLDMSEYQTPESINRLIGSEDGKKPGILTEAIKETPFNLLLLDEVEKAHEDIHMLFLQVLDDGRLTDSLGNTVYFKNVIVIATTNAGTSDVTDNFSNGYSYEVVRKLFMQTIKHFFPPEFLNRFTERVC